MEVISALGCRCFDPRPVCHRETNIRVFNWGTKFEKAVDVGRCVGSCNKGKKYDRREYNTESVVKLLTILKIYS